jgi:hypothetical protein
MKCPSCKFEWEGKRRTDRANRYWFGVVVKRYRDYWNRKNRIPYGLPLYTKNEIHRTLARVYFGEVVGPLGHMEPAETKIADSREFWEATEKARHDAWHEYKFEIPAPNEWVDVGEDIYA